MQKHLGSSHPFGPLLEENIWVGWRYEEKNGKMTKVLCKNHTDHASSTDSSTWMDYETALSYVKDELTSGLDGIGIVFSKDTPILGIDFDHIFELPSLPEEVVDFIKHANTYIEKSPSGNGLHAYFLLDDQHPLTGGNKINHEGYSYEAYTAGRFFTVTGDTYFDLPIRKIGKVELMGILSLLGYPWKNNKPQVAVATTTPTIEDSEILRKMFSARNGPDISSLYLGDISGHNNDASSADSALCSHIAFYTQDAEQIKRIWMSSPLGQREKTKKRPDYVDRTVSFSLSGITETYSSPKSLRTQILDITEPIPYILGGKDGDVPLLITENIVRAIKNNSETNTLFRLNEFSHIAEVKDAHTKQWINLNDFYVRKLLRDIPSNHGAFARVAKSMISDAILCVADETRVNPPKDYIKALVWDQVPRLDTWLTNAFGAEENIATASMGSNWFKGLVKRVITPGCQFDEVLVLEGRQGYRKSGALRALGSPWHVESSGNLDDKDFFMTLCSNIIVEFSEGDIVSRSSVKKVKSIITKTEDQFRPPYEHGMMKFSRGCVFAMTVNDTEYLKDDTGNRRWLPVKMGKQSDIPWIVENRDQLYAEAYHRAFVLHETSWEYPTEDMENLQDERMEHSDHEEYLQKWYFRLSKHFRDEGITLRDVFQNVWCDPKITRVMSKLEELQVSGVLKKTLFLESRQTTINGIRASRWFPSKKTYKKFNMEEIDSRTSGDNSESF
jgi:hypothetical protein